MSDIRKSFVLYKDLIDTTDELTDEQTGKLFRMILDQVNGREINCDDKLLKLVFIPISKTIERERQKYENKLQQKSNAGAIGNLKRWNKDIYDDYEKGNISLEEALSLAENRKTSQRDNSIANIADTVPVSDPVPVPENDIENDGDGVGDNGARAKIPITNDGIKFILENKKEMLREFHRKHKLNNKVRNESELIKKILIPFHRHLKVQKNITEKDIEDYIPHLDSWYTIKKDELKNPSYPVPAQPRL